MKRLLIILSLMMVYSVALAATNTDLYQVEIIVFKQLKTGVNEPLSWQDFQTSHQNKSIQLSNADGINPNGNFQLLPSSQFILSSQQRRLQNSSRYEVLLHQAWRQPITSHWQSIAIQGGDAYGTSNAPREIDGNLKINKERYIEVQANLNYVVPDTQSSTSYKSITLKQSQRLRSDELHYFDNPQFGMIIKIVPVKAA